MKSLLRKISVVVAILVAVVSIVACSKSEGEEVSSNEIVVGFDNTYVPMGFIDENGETVGFDIDLAKEVFNRLGMNVKFQSIDWAMKETELNSKNIDAIWNGYSLTEERKSKVSYTDAYLQNRQLIITLSDSEIECKGELKGKKLGTQQGSAALEAIEKEEELVASLDEIVLYDTYDKVFRDLEAKRVDVIVADETLARYYMNQKGEGKYKILEENFGVEDYVVAFRKDDIELRDKVNSILQEVKEEEIFNEIYIKWFKE